MSETMLSDKGVWARDRQSNWSDRMSRRLWGLDTRDLCNVARRRTQLEDFGDPPLEPAFSILVNSLEQEADLHPLGRFLMRVHLVGLLTTRLRLAEHWRSYVARMALAPIERPIFIIGMPRSGSTFLHELLAEDPKNRVPRVWEVMFPNPVFRLPNAADPRIKKAAACLWWFRRLAPQADAVFPMRAHTPHECVAIQSYSFLSEEFISTCRIPAYESFLRHADLRPAYVWQRRFLQHIQAGGPACRWVLKSPDHVHGLEALFEVFPDALVIQTHRNPLDVLKSSCHLTEVLQNLFARPASNRRIAAREAKVLTNTVERFLSFRDAHSELSARFIDITYNEIVSNPLAVIRRIYDKFEMPLTAAASERMCALANGRSRYGNGRTSAVPFDSNLEMVAQSSCFERYCSRFKLAWQPNRTK